MTSGTMVLRPVCTKRRPGLGSRRAMPAMVARASSSVQPAALASALGSFLASTSSWWLQISSATRRRASSGHCKICSFRHSDKSRAPTPVGSMCCNSFKAIFNSASTSSSCSKSSSAASPTKCCAKLTSESSKYPSSFSDSIKKYRAARVLSAKRWPSACWCKWAYKLLAALHRLSGSKSGSAAPLPGVRLGGASSPHSASTALLSTLPSPPQSSAWLMSSLPLSPASAAASPASFALPALLSYNSAWWRANCASSSALSSSSSRSKNGFSSSMRSTSCSTSKLDMAKSLMACCSCGVSARLCVALSLSCAFITALFSA